MLVKLNDISYGYQQEPVIENVNLEIHKKDFVGMIGPNGGGKSTIIKIILGLIKPWSGQIKTGRNVDGTPVKMGYLPQFHEFDKSYPITVREVILSGLIGQSRKHLRFSRPQKNKASELIESLGLKDIERKGIGELSGGQMQRVFLGRALVSTPDLLILDEPGTYVDNRFESEMYQLLETINQDTAILLVSHDIGQIVSYVKTIACVNHYLHYHPTNSITDEILASYNCPIDLITHGRVPHRVLHNHPHND